MQQLIDNAAFESKELRLTAGVALTAEQIANLDNDILWYEMIKVNGVEVLAPKLYLSQATLANVKNGALIGGDEIAISAGNINNSGSIDSSGNMTLVSQNAINNNGGLLQASNNLLLQAMNDINNIGAKIKGGNIALISEKGSINNLTESTVNKLSDNRGNLFSNTQFGNTASIEAANDLVLNAGKDINAHASNISAGGSAALQAGDNLNITSANNATQTKGHNMEKRHVEVVSSTVSTGEHLALDAGKDITVIGSQLTAGGDASLKAKGDITLQAQTNSDYSYLKTKEKKSFGRSKTTITETQTESTVGADITSGGNLTLQAQQLGDTQLAGGGSSINVIGSKLSSGGDVSLSADGDITLAAHETQTYDHKEVHKSGFGGLSKKQKGSIDYATQLTGSDVVGAGTVLINSGNDINLIASGVEAGKDASLTAMNQVLVGAGQTTESHQSWSKSSSFLSGGSLFSMESLKDSRTDIKAQGSNITAQGNVNVQSGSTKVVGSDVNAQGNILLVADTGDVQVLAAKESHSSTHKSENLEVGFGDMFKDLTPQGMIDSVKESTKSGQAKATIADATYDAVDSSVERTTHQGANLVAGGDVTVSADNDINIAGSHLMAGNSDDTRHTSNGDINLSAGNNIAITEVNDAEHTKSKETHGEASVSVKVQHQAVEVAKMVKATEEARKQAEKAKKDYKQYKKQLDSLELTLDDLQTQLANHEPGVTKQDVLELQNIIEDTKSDEAWYINNVALASANLASKVTLLAKQTAAAAQSSSTYGFDVGLEANVSASTNKNESMSSTAQGSTLAGNSINIHANKDATIQGSQVLAQDTLNLSAENVNILASKDIHSAQSSSESGSITVSTSLYEASSGIGVDVNLSNNAAISHSTHYNNSVLAGDNVNITTANDTTIKGGNVIANNTLNVDVGGDLTVESMQNRDSSSNHGMSISAGLGSKGSHLSGASAGFNQSQGRTSQTDTVISGLVSNGDAHINVKGNTDLTGSTIATLDEHGNDSGKLIMNTGSLTFIDLSNTRYSSHNNNGVNTSVGINATGIDATNNSTMLNLANGSTYSKDNTLATLGQGNVQIGEGTVLAPELNRDIYNQDKELFAVDRQQGNVDVTLDHRLLTEEGRKQIAKELKESGQNTQKMAQNVPTSEGGNAVEDTIGSLLNRLSHITGGLIPSDATDGGIIAQFPVLLGDDDIVNKVLQVGTEDMLKNKNMDDYVAIEESSYYLEASEQTQNELKGKGLYISKAPIVVQEGTATFQNGTNGMMNSEADAIKNVMSQTHNYSPNDTRVLFNLNYNPTHGFISDGVESGVDKFVFTTGVAKQTGEFIRDTTTARGKEGSNFANHSQGNLLTLQGLGYINNKRTYDQGGFQEKDHFNISEGEYALPTIAGFGSPVNTETMAIRVDKEVKFDFRGNFTNEDDFVGEVLGSNVGKNNVREQGFMENILSLDTYKNLALLFTESSPHSSYRCSDNPNAVCGARP